MASRPSASAADRDGSVHEIGGEAGALGNGQRELAALAVPHDRDLHALTGLERPHLGDVLLVGPDRRAPDRGEGVAAPPGLLAPGDDPPAAAPHARARPPAPAVDR